MGQACVTNWGSFILLQMRANVVTNLGSFIITNWGSYYKLGQPLLQKNPAITCRGNMYYKLGQLLQIRGIICNLGHSNIRKSFYEEIYKNIESI